MQTEAWFEAREALSYADPGPDVDAAWKELEEKQQKCTCGVNEAMIRFASSWYAKGWIDASESGTEAEIREAFDRNYSDLIHHV